MVSVGVKRERVGIFHTPPFFGEDYSILWKEVAMSVGMEHEVSGEKV
jgi:hypothetical protein